ncbi:MAG: hypothetical protein ACFE0Q_00970 [Anaerolineae bacterium]
MANQAISSETRTQLEQVLHQWRARWRLRRVVLFLPRVLIATFLVGMVVALVLTTLQTLTPTRLLLVCGVAMGATFASLITGLGTWSPRGQAEARQFDRLFDLQERFATALEILDGHIQTAPEIMERQLHNTYEVARNVDPRKHLPLTVNWLEWIGAFVVLLVLIGVLVFAVIATNASQNAVNPNTQAVINASADNTRDITEDVALDTALTDEERSALLETLENTLDELDMPELSAEEAFVAMSDLETDLRETADDLSAETEAFDNGLQSANETLGTPPNSNQGEALSDELADLSESAGTFSPQEQQDLAQTLQTVADALREIAPELAEQLDQASEALEQGQTQSAQQALDQASEQASASAQRNQERRESADMLDQASQQTQERAQEIAMSEGEQDQQGDNPPAEGQQADGQQGQQSEGQQGQQAGQGEQSGQGQDPNAEQMGEDGALVDSPQEGGQSAPGSEGVPSDSAPGEGQSESDEGGQGGGSGSESASQRSQDPASAGNISTDGGSDDDTGEIDYEPVFAPDAPNIRAGDSTVELEGETSNSPIIEGDFQDNPDGVSSVPYNQVFSSYAESANSALDNGYVPFSVRDVVRRYFTSIEPTGDE